jgi:hypothetical protein
MGVVEVTAMSQAGLCHEALQQFVPVADDEPSGSVDNTESLYYQVNQDLIKHG